MHILPSALTLLTLTTTALSLPAPTPRSDKPQRPKTTAWPEHNPAYSSVFATVRPDLNLIFHRYHGRTCDLRSHLHKTDNLHSPHCKTFEHAFGAYNYEWKGKKVKDGQAEALSLCQVAVFREPHCRGDAFVASPGDVNATLGGTNVWDNGARVKQGEGFCGVVSGARGGEWGVGDVGRSVKVMCVSNEREMLPEGVVVGKFGETKAGMDEGA